MSATTPDDEPEDGPSAFILLQGFTSLDLISQLSSVGVPVNAIIKVSATDWDVPVPTDSEWYTGKCSSMMVCCGFNAILCTSLRHYERRGGGRRECQVKGRRNGTVLGEAKALGPLLPFRVLAQRHGTAGDELSKTTTIRPPYRR